MKLLLITGILIFLSSCSKLILNQGMKNYHSEIEKTQYYKSANDYQKDLLFLNDLTENSFPKIESTFPGQERKQVVDSIYTLLSHPSVDDNRFNGYLRYYLSQYHNQHTRISGLVSENLFPYALYPYQGNWYLSNIGSTYDSTLIEKKVLYINEQAIENVEDNLFNYVFAENEITKRNSINELIRRPDILKQFGIIDQMDSIKLTLENDSSIWVKSVVSGENFNFHLENYEEHPVTKYSDKNYDMQFYPQEDFAYFQFNRCFDLIDARETMPVYLKPWVVPFAKMYLNRLVKKKKSPENAVGFKLDTDRPVFKDYLEQSFDSLNGLGLNHLIIDLRNNGGGSSLMCLQLLYHLTDREDLHDFAKSFFVSEVNKQLNPVEFENFVESYILKYDKAPTFGKLYPNGLFNGDSLIFGEIENKKSPYYIPKDRTVFDGEIIVLANFRTGSAAALFTALLQDNNIARVVGTTVGNNPTGATTYQPFKLPESKLKGSVASGYVTRPQPSKGKILKPDYWIENSPSDHIKGRDRYFEKALELINQPE
jgi:hypothetical protein